MTKLEIQKVPASHGLLWIKHGFRLILRSPLQAISLSMVFALGVFLTMSIPHAGVLLAVLVTPILMAGYMRVCRSLEYNEKVEPRQIIAGFQSRTARLMSLGSMLLFGIFIVSMFTAAMGGPALNSILETFQTQQDPTALIDALLAPESGLRLTLLAGFSLLFLLMLAMQFAPMLVFFDGLGPRDALKVSLVASVRNIVPFSVYSLIMQLIAFAVSVIPMGLGWIILLPIGLTSIYVAYRDIFTVTIITDTAEAGE